MNGDDVRVWLKAMKPRKLNRARLAAHLGVSANSLTRWGKEGTPPWFDYVALAMWWNFSPDMARPWLAPPLDYVPRQKGKPYTGKS